MERAENPPPVRDGLVLGAHWGFLTFFVALAGYYSVSLLSALVLRGDEDFGPVRLPELGPLVLVAFLPNLLLGLIPALGAYRWGGGLRSELSLVPTFRDVRVGLTCGGFSLLTGFLVSLLLLQVYGRKRMSNPLSEVFESISTDIGWLVVVALILVIGAPLTEELLLRGALWSGLEHSRIRPWVVLLLTAVVFAQLHGEPLRTPALLGQGIAIGAARMITGRVGSSVVAHATNNLPPALVLVLA